MRALLHTKISVDVLALLSLAAALAFEAWRPLPQSATGAAISPADTLVFSDFDSDDHPDEIELISSGTSKSISVHLSHSSTRNLFFELQEVRAGTLLTADIDSDQDLDLIWVTPNRPSLSKVWLGDGHGNFEVAPEPTRYLNAVAALEASSRGSHIAGGTGPELSTALTTGSIVANVGGKRLIAFTLPSLTYRSVEVVPICLHSSTSSERGPPLHS
jgi:hypothetical protein